MYKISKSGRKILVPTADEDAAIIAGIAADQDSREWTAKDFAMAQPAREIHPPDMYSAMVAKRPRGRPKADETKVFTAIRLDADLLDAFKGTGKGWQTRMNEALRHYLIDTHDSSDAISTMFRIEKNQFISVSSNWINSKEGPAHETD